MTVDYDVENGSWKIFGSFNKTATALPIERVHGRSEGERRKSAALTPEVRTHRFASEHETRLICADLIHWCVCIRRERVRRRVKCCGKFSGLLRHNTCLASCSCVLRTLFWSRASESGSQFSYAALNQSNVEQVTETSIKLDSLIKRINLAGSRPLRWLRALNLHNLANGRKQIKNKQKQKN